VSRRWWALVGLAAACSRAVPAGAPSAVHAVAVTPEALVADSIGTALLGRLVEAESRLREPDTLFAPSAIVIADGTPRLGVPRLAGVALGGQVQLVSTRIAASGAFVWGVIEYRWMPTFGRGLMRPGLATIVIGHQRDGGWRILHLHSSSPPIEGPDAPRPAPSETGDDAGRAGGT
jgi:hypothetical protein